MKHDFVWTGLPKGVVLTHKSLVSCLAQQVDGDNPNIYLRRDDVLLCVLPLFHIFSLNSVLLCGLRTGAAIYIMPKFEINVMLEGIEKHRITFAVVVPPLVLAMAKSPVVDKYDLGSIRVILSGAAPLGKELQEALRNRLPQAVFGQVCVIYFDWFSSNWLYFSFSCIHCKINSKICFHENTSLSYQTGNKRILCVDLTFLNLIFVMQGYGMTEAGPVLSMCLAFAKNPTPTKSGSCGTVVRNAELKVVDPETGFSLSHNQRGEICIRGPQIMKGINSSFNFNVYYC